MANSLIKVTEPSVGDKQVDTEQLTVGAQVVERERVQVAGAAAAEVAAVKNADGAGADYGLVVRPIPSATATPVTATALTDGTQKAINRGGAKGATAAADVTSTAEGADHQALDVQLYHGGAAKDPTQIRALTNADVVKVQLQDNAGTAVTVGQKAMASSLPVALASDQSALPVTDNSGSLTVDAPVGTPVFVRLSDGAAALSTPTANPAIAASALAVRDVPFSIGRKVYHFLIPSQVHVASANTVHWDMFNADASLVVRVLSIRQIPNITTAVVGIVFDWLLERTTAVGTGGTTLTAWLADTSDTALDADITSRSKPTGGATQSTDLFNYSLSSEETNAATIQIASQGGLELVPPPLVAIGDGGKGIVLRQNQGLRCVQITNSAAGNTGWLISFSVE